MKEKDMSYQLTWLTTQLAVGYAPMSYQELDSIREQGIVAIVNLCGEFTDLHEIEEQAGFEVYFLPTPDECAPDMEKMETALEWLDEALYLKKKILVHCRHGHGRTGTFISAYLLRRGLALKFTEKKLKGTRANPTNYSQWKLLKKYSKQQGQLKARPAAIENPDTVDLMPFLHEYQNLLNSLPDKPLDTTLCRESFSLLLVEAVYVSHVMNSGLSRPKRHDCLERALGKGDSGKNICPLFEKGECLICEKRPLRCRQKKEGDTDLIEREHTEKLSRDIFFALTGSFPPGNTLSFSIADTVSGRFVQSYFQALRDSGEHGE